VRRHLPAALALAALLAVPACSGGGPTVTVASPTPSRSASPAAPTLAPSAAAPGGGLAAGRLSAWKGCGGGFECATLTVPLDDAAPAKGTVGLALTRHRATGQDRIGSLLVNPGGPGASAVEFVQGSYTDFPAAVRQRFDLVAFDPRGVGRSAPVRCLSTPELDAYFHLDPVPDNPRELAALEAGNRKLAAGCQRRSGRVLPYVATTIVAQDMERVRRAVGDAKLSYLGYSYGTAIGASYLEQFPTRVRAMVLDGALDPSLTWDRLLAGQSKGFDVALNAFLAHCESTRCAFRKAVSGNLTAAYDRLAQKVETQPLPGDASRTVGPDEFQLGVGAGLYSRAYGWPAIAAALAAAERGDGAPLLALSDSYLDRSDQGYKNISEANFAVNCIDRPWPRTVKPYQDLAAEVGKSYPRFGPAIALSGLGCAVWPVAPVGRPHRVTAPGSPPVVVLGTTRDPATPYSWAVGLAGQLSRGVLLTHRGDGHTVYRAGAPGCILNPVNAYLVTLRVPAAASC
jgi:pimeloyl-ACP methyl ester carboxylesterase